jgi:hypothetical protein
VIAMSYKPLAISVLLLVICPLVSIGLFVLVALD